VKLVLANPLPDLAVLAQEVSHGHAGEPPRGGAIFNHLFAHVSPHPIGSVRIAGRELAVFNFQVFQVGAVLLILALFGYALAGLRSGRPNRFQRTLVGFVLWIRDEMVFPIMGHHHGSRFLPYFLSIFFFIAVSNLLGLFPFGVTSTASPFVTGGLAVLTLLMMIAGGMVAQGPVRFWLNLVPHGVPAPLWPVLFVVELVGLIVKPVALTIRLFANMTGGHLVVLSFLGLIFFFGDSLHGWAYGVALPAVALAVFIMIIEAFVGLLQAYIFTLLSIQFVHSSMHPEH
jgi:F-type H+-transporting ATPase subunit a